MQLKFLLLLITVSYLLTSCSHKQNSLKQNNIKGNVIKIYENTYEAVNKFGKWEIGEKQYYGNSSMTYNENGYITEYISFDKRNNIVERQVPTYDNDNVISESTVYDPDGKLKTKYKHTKDSKNRIIKTETYDLDGKLEYTVMVDYNSNDKEIGGKGINKTGKINNSWKIEWNGDVMKLQMGYDSLGKLDSKSYYEYNENNDLTSIKDTDAKDSVTSNIKITYEYDTKKNWIKKTIAHSDGTVGAFVTRRIIYSGVSGNTFNSKEIIGIWKVTDNNNWIEFKKDGTYDKGYNENIRDFGKWELNEDLKTLTLKSNDLDKSKKYSYSYEELKLILSTFEGKERTEYEKK